MKSMTFTRVERLSSKKTIQRLFSGGEALKCHPFRLIWVPMDVSVGALKGVIRVNSSERIIREENPVSLAISVPRKNIKNAVARNRVKRLIREVYRKEKQAFYKAISKTKHTYAVIIIYTSGQLPDYKFIEEKIILSLSRLQKKLLDG